MTELGIAAKMVALHRSLDAANIRHAFGGALALAWCVGEVRATMDIDLNIFVGRDRVDDALAAMPAAVSWSDDDENALYRDGQARLRWGRHPVDVFLNTTDFHTEAADRIRVEPLADAELPFLDCSDLAVFKGFFARPKDWVDLDEMLRAGSLDVARVLGVLVHHLGPADFRIERLRDLALSADGNRADGWTTD